MNTARANETLVSVGLEIRKLTREHQSSHLAEEAPWARFDNESQRFELWARNLGLYTGGHSSLDYRFRDAQLLFDHTLDLLLDLKRVLSQLLGTLTREICPEHEDIPEDSDEEDVSSYQQKPLFEILMDSAVATIDKLYRLAFKIRNPAMRLGSSRALNYREVDQQTGVDLIERFTEFDEQHIKDLFRSYSPSHPEDHYLIQRLAKANTRRRQQFRYWQKRREAFERLSTTDLVDEELDVHHKQDSGERENLLMPGMEPIVVAPSQPSTATWLNVANIQLDDDASVISTVSFIDMNDGTDADSPCLPSPPSLAQDIKEFECPYCFTICPRKLLTKKNWETHILRDLRPYICTYENCSAPNQSYDSLNDWIVHETLAHQNNAQNVPEQDEEPPRRNSSHNCAFCLIHNVSPFHIASHLQRVASFSLPRYIEDDELNEGSRLSNQVELKSQKSQLSGISFSSNSEAVFGDDSTGDALEFNSSLSLEDLKEKLPADDTKLSNVHSFLGTLDDPADVNEDDRQPIPQDVGDDQSSQTGPSDMTFNNMTKNALALSNALSDTRNVDTKTFIQVLPGLTSAEILDLRKEYKKHARIARKGINLTKHIQLKLGNSAFGKVCYATALGRWESEAYWANCYYQPSTSRSELLIETLFGRRNDEIHNIKKSFRDQRYDNSLEKCMRVELDADKFRMAVLLALEETRQSENEPIDTEQVQRDVQELHTAINLRGKVDADAMIYIIVLRSDSHLREVLQVFEKEYQGNFTRQMISKCQNLVGETLAHILNGAINRPMRDALLFHQALFDSRTNKERSELLISRLVRLHWEPQHLETVKTEFRRRYKEELEEAIAREIVPSPGGNDWGGFCIGLARGSKTLTMEI